MSEHAPAAWMELSFGRLCARIVNGGTPATDNVRFWGGHIPWVTGADFTPKGIGAIRRYISEAGVRSSATSVVKAGNLLVVTRTGVGKLAIAPFDIARRIVSAATSARAVLDDHVKVLANLRAQKLGLMQDLLTGKVPVKVPESAIHA